MSDVSGTALAVTDPTLIALCFVFVALRCYVRIRILHKFDISDALVVLAWCMFVVTCAGDFSSMKLGFWDPHLQFNSSGVLPNFERWIKSGPSGITRGLKVIYACQPITMLVVYSVKLSFLLLYRQIFPPEMRKLRIALNITFVFVGLAFVSGVCINLFWCMPIERNWSSDPATRCMAAASVVRYIYIIGCNILTDLLVYILPFFLLPKLYKCTSRRHFVGIIAMFSIGLLSIACSVAKVLSTAFGASTTTYSIWGTAEQASAIVVVCCPPLRYLVSSAISSRTPKPSYDSTTARVQTKTNWRFWRMGVVSPRDVESTVETFGAETMTTFVEAKDKEIFNRGLAPAPTRTNPKPQVKLNSSDVVSAGERQENPIRRPTLWRQVLRVDTSTSTNSKRNARKGNSTFGGTQYSTQQGNTEHPQSPISPASPLSPVSMRSPVPGESSLQPQHPTVARPAVGSRSALNTVGCRDTFAADGPIDIDPAPMKEMR